MAVLVLEARPARAALIATCPRPSPRWLTWQLLRDLQSPFTGLQLTLANSEMFALPAHPVLGFSEFALSLG
ncbi:MAG: hypothetical protein WBM90_00500, partial [Acidimicrobiia bacterium]